MACILYSWAIPQYRQAWGAINPQVFAQHSDAKLRVWFSDGVNGFQQLSPDRPFASVPYAFSAGLSLLQSAGSANIANGSVSLDMLSQDVKSQINAPIGLNRLSAEVTAKLDQNGSGVAGVVAGSHHFLFQAVSLLLLGIRFIRERPRNWFGRRKLL